MPSLDTFSKEWQLVQLVKEQQALQLAQTTIGPVPNAALTAAMATVQSEIARVLTMPDTAVKV